MGSINFGFSIEPKGKTPSLITQVHGNHVIEWPQNETKEADGLYTFNSATPIHVFTADCLPILFYSQIEKAPVAAVHSGWRGTMLGVANTLIRTITEYEKSLNAILGPCLMPCCFEVKEDFIATFSAIDSKVTQFIQSRDNKTYFDLPKYVMDQQLKGLPLKNIHTQHLKCTYCNGLPSFRRNKSTDPRIRAWITKS